MAISFHIVCNNDSVPKTQNGSMGICSSKEEWIIESALLLMNVWSKSTIKWSLSPWSEDHCFKQGNPKYSQISSIVGKENTRNDKHTHALYDLKSWMGIVKMETLSACHVPGTNHLIIMIDLKESHHHSHFIDEKVRWGEVK